MDYRAEDHRCLCGDYEIGHYLDVEDQPCMYCTCETYNEESS